MRTAMTVLLVAMTCLGCAGCGGSHQSFSVREVERVFAERGLPFASAITPLATQNPYLTASRPNFFGLKRAQERELDRHLRAVLVATDTRTFSTRQVFVFDSTASLRIVAQRVPGVFHNRKARRTVNGNSTSESGCAMQRENVFVLASYDECSKVRAILADLR